MALAAAAFSLVIRAQPAAGPAPRAGITVLSKDGRRQLPSTTINGQEMVGVADLASVLPVSVREDAAAGGLVVTVGDRTIVVSLTQGLASINGRLISLAAPPARGPAGWQLPVDFINRALAVVAPEPVTFNRRSGLMVVGALRVPQVVVRYDGTGSAPALTFGITPRTTHTITQENARLLIRFDADAVDADIVVPPGNELITGVSHDETSTTIAVDLGPRFTSFRASDTPVGDTSHRLTIEFLTTSTTAEIAPPEPAQPAFVPMETPNVAFDTIVIDPGHGGDEAGVKGAGGALEKDLTLALSRRLKAVIESRLGFRVLLTREADATVSIDERAALANNNKADLLISLHANASASPSAAGALLFIVDASQYPLSAPPDPEAERPLLPVYAGGLREVELVPWESAQARHIEHSSVFAQLVQEELGTRVPLGTRPLQQAPLRVLASANMPAILVEVGFLSNVDEERALLSPGRQNEIVQALYESVVRFRAHQDGARSLQGQ